MPSPPRPCVDLCVVGAGPAGLTIARAFEGSPFSVAVLESGGFAPDAQVQCLAAGDTFGDPLRAPVEVNRRQFGGNANIWCVNSDDGSNGVRHALLEDIDFEPRLPAAGSGWPLRRAELVPWYAQAQAALGAGPFDATPQATAGPQAAPWPVPPRLLETGVFRFSDGAVFHRSAREALVRSRNVTVYTHATAIGLRADESCRHVTAVRIARPGTSPFDLPARATVLAAGGYENARLLLLSNTQQPVGLGNLHDQVGRHYHDHLQGRTGWWLPAGDGLFDGSAFYDLRRVAGGAAMGFLRPSAALLRQEGLPNMSTMLFPRPGPRQARAIDAFNAWRWRRRNPARRMGVGRPAILPQAAEVVRVARGLDYVLATSARAWAGQQATAYGQNHGGWSQVRQLARRFDRFELWNIMEQFPRPENRVCLGPDLDMFGCPRLQVHWRWPVEERLLAARVQDLMAAAITTAGLGSVVLDRGPSGEVHLETPSGSHHLMGTTRMHADPRLGVVDQDCRVHGLANLFVAGTSVFPTGGYANPTLTLVALALRLAHHLRAVLSQAC